MDQSKWALPRNRLAQSSRETAQLLRPKTKLHCVWIHGVSMTLYLLHPGVASDSSMVCECFMRSLQDCSEIFSKHQKKMPSEVYIRVT